MTIQPTDTPVELNDETVKNGIWNGSQAFTSSETQKDVTITTVDTSMSFAVGGSLLKEGKSAYSTNDNPGVSWMTHELTSATNLRITRALTGSAIVTVSGAGSDSRSMTSEW